MNERIKELYYQCWFAIDTAGYQKDFIIDDSMGYFFDAEKFAELIVRECVKRITDQQELAETNWQCKDGIHIVYSLAEHFGVEE